MSTVCLTMIVKDESARIERCLRSALPHIDFTSIVDTGSKDGTIDVIESALDADSLDFSYFIYQRVWVDFATNRNEALALAMAAGAYDYILLLDADHELVVGDPDFRSLLTAPAYNIWQEDHGYEYANVRLLRADVAAKYVGVTHEVLVLPDGIKAETLPRDVMRIIDHADGANREGKLERDLELLLKADFQDPRTLFYIAQTYRDMGERVMAQGFYSARMSLGGWEEECWYAQYQIARLTEQPDALPQDVTHAYLMAYARRPWRAEPLWHLARYWGGRNEQALQMMFYERSQDIPLPTDRDVLFIEVGCYDISETDG